jgi:hypothetical protein
MALIALASVLLGFGLGSFVALYAVWVGLRWSGQIDREGYVQAPTPSSVQREAGMARAAEGDGILGQASQILQEWLPRHRSRGGGD